MIETYTPATAPREGLPPIPPRMQKLPLDHRGYCVPWFVEWIDGKPDFRLMDRAKWIRAVRFGNCWLCGEPVGKLKTFVLGPMCTVSRTTSEPPSHYDCAAFAVRACPFMVLPAAQYRKANMPPDAIEPAGLALDHNPTAMVLWTTASFRPFNVPNGVLITVGDPVATEWYHRGRAATREEALAAVSIGLPKLRAVAEEQGAESVKAFEVALAKAMALVPA